MYLTHANNDLRAIARCVIVDMTTQEVQLHNRFTSTMQRYAAKIRNNSTTIEAVARRSLGGFFTTAHHALMVSGIAALCTLAVMVYRPDLAHTLNSLVHQGASGASPGASQLTEISTNKAPMDMPAKRSAPSAVPPPSVPSQMADATGFDLPSDTRPVSSTGTERQQRWVTNWLSKRYRVANDATDMLVSAAYVTAKETRIDPLLILAVVAIESGFNPFAESAVGAQGLMQVMSKVHQEKFQYLGGVKAALNPVANIRVGSMILKDYVSRGGSVEAGLKMYVGAAAFDNDAGYGTKVLAEYHRLKEVAAGHNVPLFVTPPAAVVVRNQPKAADTGVTLPKEGNSISEKNIVPEATGDSTAADRFVIM